MPVFKVQDFFFKKAKSEGYRSRAAYKLKEILQKKPQLKKAKRIVDLGCAPGGFLQVLLEVTSQSTLIVGVDLKPVQYLGTERVKLVQGDAETLDVQEKITKILGGKAQLIVSDMAPSTSGVKELDAVRSLELCEAAFKISCNLLDEGGSLVMKIFENEETQTLRAKMKAVFSEVKATRPSATRKGSRELYLIATGFTRE